MQFTINKHVLHAAFDAISGAVITDNLPQSEESIDVLLDEITEEELTEARRAYNRQYYHEHKEAMLAAQKRWRRRNHDKVRQYRRKWCRDNPERLKEYQRRADIKRALKYIEEQAKKAED